MAQGEQDDARLWEKVDNSVDRLQEAHFYLHQMENFYHFSDPFRYSLSSFLKSLKEVPQIVHMELQGEPAFPNWNRPKRTALLQVPLIRFLNNQRDTVVHKGMLVPTSFATLGITEGRGIKLGLGNDYPAHLDSDEIILHYLRHTGDPLGIMDEDEDSAPCVDREWKLAGFDTEVITLCGEAWLIVKEYLAEVLTWLGMRPPEIGLHCLHTGAMARVKWYDRGELRERLEREN